MFEWARSVPGLPLKPIQYDPRLLDQEIAAEYRPIQATDLRSVRIIAGRWEDAWIHGSCWCRHAQWIHRRDRACDVMGCACTDYHRREAPVVRVAGVTWQDDVGEVVWITDGLVTWSRHLVSFLVEYRPL